MIGEATLKRKKKVFVEVYRKAKRKTIDPTIDIDHWVSLNDGNNIKIRVRELDAYMDFLEETYIPKNEWRNHGNRRNNKKNSR